MAKAILGQSSCGPSVIAQVVKNTNGVFWVSLEAEETQSARNSTNFLKAVLCFFSAVADGCLPAWERASKPEYKELSSWSRMLHREALGSHTGIPTTNPNNAPAELLTLGASQQLALSMEEQTKFLESVVNKRHDACKEKWTK